MKTFWYSRRSFVAGISVLSLLILGLVKNVDVSTALASIAIAIGASNAAEGIISAKKDSAVK